MCLLLPSPLGVELPCQDPALWLSRCECPGCEPIGSDTAVQQVALAPIPPSPATHTYITPRPLCSVDERVALRSFGCVCCSIVTLGQASEKTLVAGSPIQTSAADLIVTYDENILGEKNVKPALPLSFSTVNGVRAQLVCDQHIVLRTCECLYAHSWLFADALLGVVAVQVTMATDVANQTVAIDGSYNFCNQQVYTTDGVLLPAASYAQVPETYLSGAMRT